MRFGFRHHVLVRNRRQLASQLTGRLLGIDDNDIQALLKQTAEKAPRPSLWPLRGNLTPPGGPLKSLACRTAVSSEIARWRYEWVKGVAITPDGLRAVSASDDHTLRVWDLESGQSVRTLEGHSSSVNGVAITPDGRRAISASWDHTLRVWDLESGKELALLTADSPTASCAVSLDGRTIVAGDAAGNMHILKMEGFGPDQHIHHRKR